MGIGISGCKYRIIDLAAEGDWSGFFLSMGRRLWLQIPINTGEFLITISLDKPHKKGSGIVTMSKQILFPSCLSEHLYS